jgi:hypothetical protein
MKKTDLPAPRHHSAILLMIAGLLFGLLASLFYLAPTNQAHAQTAGPPGVQCPPYLNGNNLQVAIETASISPGVTLVCIRVSLAINVTYSANLDNTLIFNSPAPITDAVATFGTVNFTANSVTWRPGNFAAGRTTEIFITINTANSSLSSFSTEVTGVFSNNENIRRIINGMIRLTEIAPSNLPTSPGGGNRPPVVPGLPNTGNAGTVNFGGGQVILIFALIGVIGVGVILGLLRRQKKTE